MNTNTIQKYTDIVNKALNEIEYPAEPDELYAPIRYELSLGGKRIRPVMTLMACEMFGVDFRQALAPALGVEIFHNFTLLHDDVMDHADVRRGKPTVHKVWNENAAILSGDAMQTMAFRYISKAPAFYVSEVIALFEKTAMEIYEGQQLDMNFECREDVTEGEYLNMIRLKTAVLLGCALKIGAVVAGATFFNSEKLYQFGIHIGLAFQLQDDYLDVYGDPAVFGKNIGGDILNNKKTYMLIHAMNLAQNEDRTELDKWLSVVDYKPEEKISAVIALYNRLGIKRLCEEKINDYYKQAMDYLYQIEADEKDMKPMMSLATQLLKRNH